MWNWGRGNLGQFGNGFEEHLIYPEVNPLWESISKTAHLQIVKLKSVADGTVALMSKFNLRYMKQMMGTSLDGVATILDNWVFVSKSSLEQMERVTFPQKSIRNT